MVLPEPVHTYSNFSKLTGSGATATQRGVRTKTQGVAQREAHHEAQGIRRGCAAVARGHGVAQGWRRGGAPLVQGVAQGVAQV